MVGAGQTAAASRDPSSGETAIREFANGDLAPGKLRQRAGSLLNSEGLLQKVLRLTQRDQTKFVDKVDQVRRDLLSPLESSHPCKGIPNRRPAKCKIRKRVGDSV